MPHLTEVTPPPPVIALGDLVSNDWFSLRRQPIVPLQDRDKGLPHYEILMRLTTDPESSPAAFIRMAERSGHMPVIDRQVISKTFKQLSGDRSAHYSINICGQTISEADFGLWVSEQMGQWSVEPSQFTFELTESSPIRDLEKAKKFTQWWRSLGGGFALDDFGAGCTNLVQLRDLPVSLLKIDGAITQTVIEDPATLLAVDFFVNLSRLRGIQTVAEWVDSQPLQVFLRELGVDWQQGWLTGRAEPF